MGRSLERVFRRRVAFWGINRCLSKVLQDFALREERVAARLEAVLSCKSKSLGRFLGLE
ncbi:MAG: hypothetical protein ACRKFN_08055 [Desulfitobacterium sp.]